MLTHIIIIIIIYTNVRLHILPLEAKRTTSELISLVRSRAASLLIPWALPEFLWPFLCSLALLGVGTSRGALSLAHSGPLSSAPTQMLVRVYLDRVKIWTKFIIPILIKN